MYDENNENARVDKATSGSDELLSNDDLRLPEGAHALVRVHAVQAWLNRRVCEATLALGEAALALKAAQVEAESNRVMRRRERERQEELLRRYQQQIEREQARIETYEETQELLQEYIDHAGGERVLVEFYLALEMLTGQETHTVASTSTRLDALADVQHRVERVGITDEPD